MKLLLAVAVASTAAVSACLDAPLVGDPPVDAPVLEPFRFPWGLSDCAFVIAVVPVEPAKLAKVLPPGFAASPTRLSLVPAGPTGALELDAYRCRSGVGLDGPLSPVEYGSYYVAVDPPEQLREAGYHAYFVKFDFLVPDGPRRATLASLGLPARPGSAAVTVASLDAGGPVSAQLDPGPAGGFRLTGTVAPPEDAGSALPFMEFTPIPGGLAKWHARLHDARIGSGAGTLEVVPGSWAAELVGSPRVPVTFAAGQWNLDQADLTLPIAWPPPP